MERVLGRFAPQLYAVMRIVIGLLFACHGADKLFGAFGGQQVPVMSMLGLAGVIEFFGGLMIAIGFQAGTAAFFTSGLMAAAYFTAHAPSGPLPIKNQGELAVVYCFIFLYIAARGSGVWAVDRTRGPRR